MKFIVGYTRNCLYAPEHELMWGDVYDSLQEIDEERSSDPDLNFYDRSLIGMGFKVVDFYVLKDIRGDKSYMPIRLVNHAKRFYRGLTGNLSKRTQDQF